ncbi:MAG: ComEC/Rec2 family competence protein [Actinobacteria bacterium]|nr:ComEC/Rec2 family competence protein [Actinomycetota bacterium]
MARAPRHALMASGLVVCGAAAGSARLNELDVPLASARHASHVEGRAILLERPRRGRFDSSAAVEIASGPAAGSRALARVRNGTVWPAGGTPGTEVVLRGPLSAPKRRLGEALDWPSYLRRRGIGAELEVDSIAATGRRRRGIAGAVDRMREAAERALGAGASRGCAAVARGMVLGEDEQIDPLVRDDFRRSGLAHVLAVSGQNVMLLCALATPLLAGLGVSPRTRVLALTALIALYVPLAGAGPSLQRAGVMGVAGLVALGAGRVSSRWYALLLAAVVTLLVNPRVAEDPGWQLSFAAVAGILVLGPGLRRTLGFLPRPLADGAAITIAATIATAPLLAHHFGAVSLVGIVANLIAIPLVAPIMWAGMTQAALGISAAALPALAPPFGPVVAAIGRVNGVLVGWLTGLARYFGELPGSHVALPLRNSLAVAGAYAAMCVLGLAIRLAHARSDTRRSEAAAAWRRSPRRTRFVAIGVAIAACASLWHALTGPPRPPDSLTVSFLDVGQGDATLIQDGPRAAVLFDGGPPEARVARLLRDAGVRRLALVVATHQSRDHQGGLPEVLTRFHVDALLDGGDGTRDRAFADLLALARRRGVRRLEPRPGQVLRAGALTIRILGPPPRARDLPPPDDPNLRAITAVVSEGWFDLFLSADAESTAILGYPLPPVEAMKVPHHGSSDPGLPAVLARLHPAVAAIEVGAHNSYGHPAPSTLAALRRAVPHVYRTDRDGTIRLTVEARRLRVATAR